MQYRIELEIYEKRYIPLLDVEQGARGQLTCTTILENQRRAIVSVYLVSPERRRTLASIEVRDIPRGPAGVPKLSVQGRVTPDLVLELRVLLNGTVRARERIPLKRRITPARHLGWILPAAAGLFLLVFFLIVPAFKPDSRTVEESTAPETAGEAGTAAESGEEEQASEADVEPAEAEPTVTESAGTEPGEMETTGTEAAEAEPVVTEPSMAEPAEAEPAEAEPAEPMSLVGEILPETVYFQPDSAVLTSETKEVLEILADQLARYPDLNVIITGHCALEGTEEGRIRLSLERAGTVRDYLTTAGWNPEKPAVIEGLGASVLVTRDPEQEYLNRRVEITLSE